MITFAGFCRDLFLLAQTASSDGGPAERGQAWERRVGDYLGARGIRTDALPGGCRLLGHASLSGLAHQLDGAIACSDAMVVAEWKAYRGPIPKNELLRFKAVSDDFYLGMRGALPRRPIMRVFGGTGELTEGVRRYAALHGIVLVAPGLWPAPVLAAAHLGQDGGVPAQQQVDRRRLAWLSRPMQHGLQPRPDGCYVVPCPPAEVEIDAVLRLHDYWSDVFWEDIDLHPGRFERHIALVTGPRVAA